MSFNGEENQNIEYEGLEKRDKKKRIILTSADQIPDVDVVTVSIKETEDSLRERLFTNETTEKTVSRTQRIRSISPTEIRNTNDEKDYVLNVPAEEKIFENETNAASGSTTRYNPEMVIEELKRTEPEEQFINTRESRQNDYFDDSIYAVPEVEYIENHGRTSSMRKLAVRDSKPSPKGGYRPVTTSPKVFGFGLDEIPDASSQLTRRAKLNDTLKVVSRTKKIEKSGKDGRIEPDCEEVLTFEFEGMSNAHVPLDNDSVFQIEGVNGYPGTNLQKRPPVTRRRKKYKSSKKGRRPHGIAFRIVSALLLILIVFICVFGYDFAMKVCDDRAMDSSDLSKIQYTVDSDTTDEEVAEFLVSNGMVESELYYKLRAILFEADYVPGTYEISPSYSTEKIINILSGYDYSAGS